MSDDQHNSLSGALAALGRAEQGAAPRSVERALLRELGARRRRRRLQHGSWLLAAAAGLAMMIWLGGREREPIKEAAMVAGVAPGVVEPLALTPVEREPEVRAPKVAPRVRQPVRRGTVAPAREFIPVGFWSGNEPMDRGTIVRVRLPKSALPAMGIPVSAERWGETVPAQVLLAEDGIVRAVRFE